MRRIRQTRRRKVEDSEGAFQAINITPFTDVLLVLLIIFLIAGSSLSPSGVDVEKLSARAEAGPVNQGEPKTIRLHVSESGGLLRSSGQSVSATELEGLKRSEPLDLTATGDCTVGVFVAEYDKLLKMGFRDVRLAEPSSLEFE